MRIKTASRLLIPSVTALILAFPGPASAAPSNDSRANAAPIEIGDFLQGDNTDATINPAGEALTSTGGTDGCQADGTIGPGGNQMDKTLWWHFVGNGAPLTVSTKLSNFDTIAAVYTQDVDGFLVFQGCNDDAGPDTLGSELVVGTDDGVDYWIQVGGCDQCPTQGGGVTEDSGTINLALNEPPANDQRVGARPVALGTSAEDFTFGALSDSGETLTCGPVVYDKTVWYRVTTPAIGTLTLTGSGFPNVVSAYRSNGQRAGCAAGGGSSSTLRAHLAAGTYFVQVGGQGEGTASEDGDLNLRADFVKDPTPVVDTDGDGVPDNVDKCPTQNAAARDADRDGCLDPDPDSDHDGVPVGADKCPAENASGRDKNHDGCLDPLPRKRVSADAKLRVSPTATGVRVVSLRVIAPRGAKVTVRCGPGCRFAKRASASSRSRDVLATAARTITVKKLAGRSLRAGQKLRIYVTRKGRIGAYMQWTIKRGDISTRINRCLNPGSMKPRKRCR